MKLAKGVSSNCSRGHPRVLPQAAFTRLKYPSRPAKHSRSSESVKNCSNSRSARISSRSTRISSPACFFSVTSRDITDAPVMLRAHLVATDQRGPGNGQRRDRANEESSPRNRAEGNGEPDQGRQQPAVKRGGMLQPG